MSRLPFRDDFDLGSRQLLSQRQARGNRRELGRRHLGADVRLQSSKQPQVSQFLPWAVLHNTSRLPHAKRHDMARPCFTPPIGCRAKLALHHERRPEISFVREDRPRERRRRDADDREWMAIQVHDLAERLGIRAEMRAPQAVADDDHWMAVRRAVIVWREGPAVRRANAKHVEVVSARDLAVDDADLGRRAGGRRAVTDGRCHVSDRGQGRE